MIHPGYASRLVDDDVAFQAAHVLAKKLHDRYCGCATYCEKPQDENTWHDDARALMGVVLGEFDKAYS